MEAYRLEREQKVVALGHNQAKLWYEARNRTATAVVQLSFEFVR